MKIKEVADSLELEEVVVGDLDVEVKGGHAGDLLSNVMAKAKAGDLWFTIQGHQNIVAVALLVETSGIVVAEDVKIDEETISRAKEKGINLFKSSNSIYELCGKLYQLRIE